MRKTKTYLLVFLVLSCISFQFELKGQSVFLTKAVDLATAQSGQQVQYTLEFGCSSLVGHCEGAIIVDPLPDEISFDGAGTIIVQSMNGPIAIAPTYDVLTHTIMYDFTVLPENGIPAGFSANVTINGTFYSGIIPDGTEISNSASIIANISDGTDTTTTVVSATPKWTLTKQVASGIIYHDAPITYLVKLCSDTEIGNLNLSGVLVTDDLPAGSIFQSASNGGIHNGLNPGSVTWNLGDVDVTSGCTNMEVVIIYPATDPNNNTGLTTPIPKLNTVLFTGTPVGDTTINITATTNEPLNPPNFNMGIVKEAMDNGILPVGAINYFNIGVGNSSTMQIDNYTVIDVLPPQFDLVRVRSTAIVVNPVLFDLMVELNNSGSFTVWQVGVNTNVEQFFDVGTIPGYVIGTDYVSKIKWDFGTVPKGFHNNLSVVVEASFPLANDNSNTNYDSYINNVFLTANNPIDGTAIDTLYGSDDMCITTAVARLEPNKSHEIDYISAPEGSVTQGNPYFLGARVKYHIYVENDGTDDTETDITSAQAFQDLINPIGSDLLPLELTYIPNSWSVIQNNTGDTYDNSGTNPTFEQIDNFNGTGRTLLRWQFNGTFEPGEVVRIDFNATINSDATVGSNATNDFCLSAPTQDFICSDTDCGETSMTDINNFFGTTAIPTDLMPNIIDMCCSSSTFVVADSTSVPQPEKTTLTDGPFAPTGTDLVNLGLASDTIVFVTTLNNSVIANSTLPNPIGMDLLPEQLEYIPNSFEIVENTTGLTFTNDGSNPVFEIIHDFNGSGRTLLKWTYSGEFPIDTKVSVKFNTLIKAGAGGEFNNQFVSSTNERYYTCPTGSAMDNEDLDGDGDATENLCSVGAGNIQITSVKSLSAITEVRGTCDNGLFHNSSSIASTYHADTVQWRLLVSNPGNETLTGVSIVDIFPYIGDVGVQLNDTQRETGWTPYVSSPIIAPTNTTLYYSQSTDPCRNEMNPIIDNSGTCVNDWTTTAPLDLSTIKAIKLELDTDLEGGDSIYLDVLMTAPTGTFPSTGQIAWNSLARNANELPAQEPNKVGIKLCLFDLALVKTLDTGQASQFEIGDDVNFTIKIHNQGIGTADSIEITDYIPSDMGLNDGSWTIIGQKAKRLLSVTNGELPAGGLLAGDSVSVGITLTLNSYPLIDPILVNWAEISSQREFNTFQIPTDIDSTPDDVFENDVYGTDNDLNGDGSVGSDEDDHDPAQIPTRPQIYDWGDLPDLGNGTSTGNYKTIETDNGPRHLITDGLKLGVTIDEEQDGQSSPTAVGDGDDEDAIQFTSNLNIVTGGTLRLQLTTINTTGLDSYLEAWVDWNGDGDFDDVNEMIADFDDSLGAFPSYLVFNIPTGVPLNQYLGVRIRLSNEDNMTPYGKIESGEVEDYMFKVTCPQNRCMPISITQN